MKITFRDTEGPKKSVYQYLFVSDAWKIVSRLASGT